MGSIWQRRGNIFDLSRSQVPVVLDDEEGLWKVFFSDRVGRKSIPKMINFSPDDFSIHGSISEPILDLGSPGMFDWAGVMPTEVARVGDDIFLYYIGWSNRLDVPYHNNLGLAISKDGGQSFSKYSEGPVFSTSSEEPGYIGTISVMDIGESFIGWYLSCRKWSEIEGRMEPFYDIKYATSEDGISWKPRGITCIKLRKGEGGLSQASVRKIGGVYHMWFSYRMESDFRQNPNRTYKIGYAQSIDGKVWERYDSPELFPSGNLQEWDGVMTAYPYVVQWKKELLMFYNGNGFGETGIGIASTSIDSVIQRI